MTAWSITSSAGGWSSWRRRSWSRRSAFGVMVRPRQPRLARSSTAHTSDRQERSPGSRPMTLVRRRVSPKVRSMKLEWRMRCQCSAGNRRWTVSEARSSVTQATAAGIAALPGGGERGGLAAGDGDGLVAGLGVADVEDGPEVGLHLGLVVRGDLGQDVAGAVDQAALAQAGREARLEGADEAGGAVADAQQRRAAGPRAVRSARKSSQASVDSDAAGARPTNTGWPSVSMPQAASTGSAGAPGCILKWRAVQEQVVEPHAGQVAGPPGVELARGSRCADPAHRRLRQRRLGAEHLGQGGLDVAVRQAPHPAGDDQGLQRVGAGHARRRTAGSRTPRRCRAAWAAAARPRPSWS